MQNCNSSKWVVRPLISIINGVCFFLLAWQLAWSAPNEIIKTRYGNLKLSLPPLTFKDSAEWQPFLMNESNLPKLPLWEEAPPSKNLLTLFSQQIGLYKEGLEFYRTKQFKEALADFDRIITEFPQGEYAQAAQFWKGRTLMELLEEENALKAFWSVLGTGKYSNYLTQSAHAIVWISMKNGDYSTAFGQIEQLREIISAPLFTENIMPLETFGYRKKGELDKALEILLKWKEQFPSSPKMLENVIEICELMLKLNRNQEIIGLVNDYSELYFNDPRVETLLFSGVWAEIKRKNYAAANKRLLALTQRGTAQKKALIQASMALEAKQGRFQKALEKLAAFNDLKTSSNQFRTIIRQWQEEKNWENITQYGKAPYHSHIITWEGEFHLIMAVAFEQLDQAQAAYVEYQNALHRLSDSHLKEQALYRRAAMEMRNGDFSTASTNLNQMLVDYGETERVGLYSFWYGVTLAQLESPNALIALRQVDYNSPRAADSLYLQAKLYQKKNDLDRANQTYSQLISQFPDADIVPQAYLSWTENLLDHQQTKEARRVLDEWKNARKETDIPPELSKTWIITLIKLGEIEQAIVIIDETLKKDASFEILNLKFQALEQQRAYDKIFSQEELSWKPALTDAERLQFWQIKAKAARHLGKNKEAHDLYQKIIAKTPVEEQRPLQFQLVKIAYENKGQAEFVEQAESLLKVSTTDATANNVLILLANYYTKKGDAKKAQGYQQTLVNNYEQELKKLDLSGQQQGELYLDLAEIKNLNNEVDTAKSYLEKAEQLKLPSLQFRIDKENALTAYHEKRYQDAVSGLLQIAYQDTTLEPDQRYEIWLKIAKSYQHLEQKDEAKAIFKKMLKEFTATDKQKDIKELMEKNEKLFQ